MSLRVRTSINGDIAVLEADGRIVLGEESMNLREAVKTELSGGRKKIALVLQDVSYVDSSGFGQLIASYTATANAGGEMVLVSPAEKVSQALQVTKIATIFNIFGSVDEAVAYFKKSEAQQPAETA